MADIFASNRQLLPAPDSRYKGLGPCCDYCCNAGGEKKKHVPAAVKYDFGDDNTLLMCAEDYDRIRMPYEPTFAELTTGE